MKVDKSNWPTGPWTDEPDEMSWVDYATGYRCEVRRGPIGALCGYVRVPDDHPLYRKSHIDIDTLRVHGGITFSCFRNGGWWFGFDCCHGGDIAPAFIVRPGYHTNYSATYKNLAYCWEQCTQLAAQLSKLEEHESTKKDV